MEITQRPRRLRKTDSIRRMVRETRIHPASLVYPIFIKEGLKGKEEIPAMPGQYRYGLDILADELKRIAEAGIEKVLLFGLPLEKDEIGSAAFAENGIIQQALRLARKHTPELVLIPDTCMCEYTSHGHCGALNGEIVDNDETLKLLAKTALSQAEAGADLVAPSDMMDGRVGAIRRELDQHGYQDVGIMSYAVKYASCFYSPFRDAAGSAPAFGDRRTYQMDYHNRKEAIREALLDVEEGADILIVKPAMTYLDIVREVSDLTQIPTAAYSVSGEYSMIKAAAAAGYIDEAAVVSELAVSTYRAGADIYISYYAKELVSYLKEGRIS